MESIKFGDFMRWQNIGYGFVCYSCGKEYPVGKHRVMKHNGRFACIECCKKANLAPNS